MGETRDVLSAGAVVTRKGGDVLLVHRPKHDDWSFPKGKLEPGEHALAAAVREVEEETGLRVRLGPPLAPQHYALAGGRAKTVRHWVARVVGSDDVGGYAANDEIDEVAWLPWEEAAQALTYDLDRATLAEARPLRRRTRAFVVLRHGQARSRSSWASADPERPLAGSGEVQARALVPLLAAYGVSEVVTSPHTRCVDTVAPFCRTTGVPMREYDALGQEAATTDSVVGLVDDLVDGLPLVDGLVLCSHRPVLPTVLDALGAPDVALEPGEMLVAHLRQGRVVAVERHRG